MRSRAWWSWIRFYRINYVGTTFTMTMTNNKFTIFDFRNFICESFTSAKAYHCYCYSSFGIDAAMAYKREQKTKARPTEKEWRKKKEKRAHKLNDNNGSMRIISFSHSIHTRERESLSIAVRPAIFYRIPLHFTLSTSPSLSLFLRQSIFKVNFDVVSLQVSMF